MPAEKRTLRKVVSSNGIKFYISDKVLWMGDDPTIAQISRETTEFLEKVGLPEQLFRKKPWSIEDMAKILPKGDD